MGEKCDIPSWTAESGLRGKNDTDLKDNPTTLVFPPYASDATAPIDEEVDRFMLNAYASQIRYAGAKIVKNEPAL